MKAARLLASEITQTGAKVHDLLANEASERLMRLPFYHYNIVHFVAILSEISRIFQTNFVNLRIYLRDDWTLPLFPKIVLIFIHNLFNTISKRTGLTLSDKREQEP